ncbi:MAG: helix-turn-helix domain-containing protein, partial [Opitutales bacterium]|nr:helix-turn-helix domain-containing protein [Opitutales bacterium]
GWSLEDVSGKLNISKEILAGFEAGEFSVKLPEIYARGFFIAYVKLLNLNTSTLLAEYETLRGASKKTGFPSLGRLQFETGEETVQDTKVLPETSENPPKRLKVDFRTALRNRYFIFFAVIGAILLLLFGCRSRKKTPSVDTENVTSSVVNEVEIIPALTEESATVVTRAEPSMFLTQGGGIGISDKAVDDGSRGLVADDLQTTTVRTLLKSETDMPMGVISSETVTLVASAPVQVFVRTERDKKRVFFGTLEAGARQSVPKEAALQVSFSEGGNLIIERSDGTAIRPQTSGRGWIRIP